MKEEKMKYWMIIILAVVIHINGFTQNNYLRIKVSNDIELVKLSENAYLHISTSEITGFGLVQSNGLIFINGKESFLFDTPVTDSQTKVLVAWIRDLMKLKIVGFAPNHWHSDCMGGLAYLQSQGIESYASQKTIDKLIRKFPTAKIVIPGHGEFGEIELIKHTRELLSK